MRVFGTVNVYSVVGNDVVVVVVAAAADCRLAGQIALVAATAALPVSTLLMLIQLDSSKNDDNLHLAGAYCPIHSRKSMMSIQ